MKRDHYLIIKDDDNNTVFSIEKNGIIQYTVDGRLREVDGDETMLRAVEILVDFCKKELKE